jgi:ubiquinone/menaquinone biosynthesis C-methylase UbiE
MVFDMIKLVIVPMLSQQRGGINMLQEERDVSIVDAALVSPEEAARLYTRLARVYDFFSKYEQAHHHAAIEMANIQNDEQVLEVACGTGRATVELARRVGQHGMLYALDLTPAMLAQARRKLEKEHLIDRVELRQGDARHLPYPDEMFDLIYNAYMFDLIKTAVIPDIVSEFKRVLKPGGRLVLVNTSKQGSKKSAYEFLYEKGVLGSVYGGCRPVMLAPFLRQAGFERVARVFRPNGGFLSLNPLQGTEIVTGNKREAGPDAPRPHNAD